MLTLRRSLFLLLCATISCALRASATAGGGIQPATGQVIIGVADGWNAQRALLYLFQRRGPQAPWQAATPAPWPVLLGRSGLAWGNGAVPVPHGQAGISSKREKDWRAPAGLFQIGKLYGYAPAAPRNASWPYHQVTARDCWIDDPQHPSYNRHLLIDPNNPPPWYEKQRMRLGDSAYRWMLEIRHNSSPPIPGHGSAIFFHTRRGPTKPSAGCTTMALENLESLIRWLQPNLQPVYILLPRAEYQARVRAWNLPPLP